MMWNAIWYISFQKQYRDSLVVVVSKLKFFPVTATRAGEAWKLRNCCKFTLLHLPWYNTLLLWHACSLLPAPGRQGNSKSIHLRYFSYRYYGRCGFNCDCRHAGMTYALGGGRFIISYARESFISWNFSRKLPRLYARIGTESRAVLECDETRSGCVFLGSEMSGNVSVIIFRETWYTFPDEKLFIFPKFDLTSSKTQVLTSWTHRNPI